jgi:uncharacterized iron-regulated membrane protein
VPAKLRPSTYKAWWDLHAWAGLLASLLAYVMFFFGTWTLFHAPLQNWQEPRGPVPTLAEVDGILDAAVASGEVSARRVRIFLPRERSPGLSLTYMDAAGERQYRLIERHGIVEPRSELADLFYGLHYLQPPSAPRWLYVVAGLVSALLLLVIVTGTLIHLRQLWGQLHQFRIDKGARVALSDAHKLLGVLGLPFVAVYAFTGAWLGLDSVLAPRVDTFVFGSDERAASVAKYGAETPPPPPSGQRRARRPLAELLARAERAPLPPGVTPHDPNDCRSVYLHHLDDRNGTAEFHCGPSRVLLRQVDASLVVPAQASTTWLTRLGEVPYAMHFVEFARWPLRALYALLALAGCGAILTGNWLWLEGRAAHFGTGALRRLTLATVAGSLIATSAALGATRLSLSAELETRVFWMSWLICAAGSALCRSTHDGWRQGLLVAGALFMATPVVGLAQLGNEGRAPLLPGAGLVDSALLLVGLACLSLRFVLGKRRARALDGEHASRGAVGVA